MKFSNTIKISVVACASMSAPGYGAPDVIAGDVQSPTLWGTDGGISAYSFGATHCNVGESALGVNASNNQHYIFTQNLYRYRVVDGSGRFEQLGQGWVFHSFCSLQTNTCATCSPACAGCCSQLGVGCSDSNTSARVGSQSALGPRWEVNPLTASFAFPHAAPGSGTLAGRTRVSQADLDPSLNPGAIYAAEVIELAPDDALGSNQNNNASYRLMNVGVLGANGYPLTVSGAVVRQLPAINAWLDQDPGVGVIFNTPSSGVGRYSVGVTATDLGNGMWHYEYAVFNLNSDRAAGSFSVPLAPWVAVTNIGFHDVDYHSNGNPYDGTDWSAVRDANGVTWSTTPHANNPNANALRWGTLYNFRFDANVAPSQGSIEIGLFKPGTPTSVSVAGIKVPAVPPPPACPGDANGDSSVNSADLSVLLSQFGSAVPPGSGADSNGDGTVNSADLSVLLGAFGASC